ncbi:MAG TPA: hypothetical protein P5294_05335 [Smithellaceae bacterium]|nr:hypothetical protein [Smithellaceae bacterium]HRV25936.1 hypothetical protein [Smithellaceae bacterium]
MCLVGRQRELRQITKALKDGYNVIIKGSFGIGKTSLAAGFAAENSRLWQFSLVDFSQTADQMAKALMSQFFPQRRYKSVKNLRYKAKRYILSQSDAKNNIKQVIILDNIVKVTSHRFAFLRELLLGGNYLFIAIVESFLPRQKLFDLRAQLYPAEMIELTHLSKHEASAYFTQAALKYNLAWTKKQITALAEISRGYPLGMHETVKRHLRLHSLTKYPHNGEACGN